MASLTALLAALEVLAAIAAVHGQSVAGTAVPAVQQFGSAAIPAVQQNGSAAVPVVPAVRQNDSAAVPAPAVRQNDSAAVPAVPAPAVRQNDSAAVPAVPAPAVRQNDSAAVPAPAVRQNDSAAVPAVPAPAVRQTDSAAVPAVRQTDSAAVPSVQQDGSAAVPSVQQDGSAAVPAVQQDGSAAVPAVQQDGSAAVPAVQLNGSAEAPTGLREEEPSSCQDIVASEEPHPAWVDNLMTHCTEPCLSQSETCLTSCDRNATCITACIIDHWRCMCRCSGYIPASGIEMKHLQKAHCIMSLLPDLTDYANVSESLDGISTVIACQMVWHDKAEKECGAKCVGQDKATCRMTCAMMYQMEGICKWCLRAPVDASTPRPLLEQPEGGAGAASWTALVVVPVLAGVAWLGYQLAKQRRGRQLLNEAKLQMGGDGPGQSEGEPPTDPQLPYDARFEFPKARLHLGPELGRGQFGVVRRALALGIVAGEAATTVAVKMVRSDDDAVLKALATELKIMIHLGKHANIANLLGACTVDFQKKELLLILEYCEHGCLLSILRRHRPDSAISVEDATEALVPGDAGRLTTTELLGFAFQVARGMDFLAGRGVVHSDLATRNVLLTADRTVKICDFGLARHVDADGNYVKRHMTALPLRWMAVESFQQRVFSSQSDVWAFGVLLWELFSAAATPYDGMDAHEICQRVAAGLRLPRPADAPDAVYALMMECWELLPALRPTFPDLVDTLGRMLDRAECQRLEALDAPYELMNSMWRQQPDYTDHLALLGGKPLYANVAGCPLSAAPATEEEAGPDYLPMAPLGRLHAAATTRPGSAHPGVKP